MLKVSFSNATVPTQDALILIVAEGGKLGTQGVRLDQKLGGAIKRAIKINDFKGGHDQSMAIVAPAKTRLSRIILVGVGDSAKLDEAKWQSVGGSGIAALGNKDAKATFIVDDFGKTTTSGDAAAEVALGALLRSYRFDKYHTKQKPEQKQRLKNLTVATAQLADAKKKFVDLQAVADGVFLTRDLVSEPPNVIYPQTMADICLSLRELGVVVEVLDEKQMKKLGMGALLGVAQGSAVPPRLVTMLWQGDKSAKDQRPVALVGKGVTFDSGGLSLKPPAGMEDMKWDMAGAGAVIGAMRAIAGRKAKANVIGVVGLVENMPSGTAQRPGDVVTTMSGQTVEVLNTDAEGRLVLSDALWYVQEKFKPREIVDLATLTGAIIVSLGHEYAGLFSNDDALSQKLVDAGKNVDELLWRFPLAAAYDKDIDSPIADMKNIGARGAAGSITAAQFLQRFIKKGTAWAHLDIAGTAWLNRDKPLCPKGASAFGVRLLNRFVGG